MRREGGKRWEGIRVKGEEMRMERKRERGLKRQVRKRARKRGRNERGR